MTAEAQPTLEDIDDERRRARRLRMVVDLTTSVLMQSPLSVAEAEEVVAATRRHALDLFPGKEETFDLVLAPRFARLIREFVAPRQTARVLHFPSPGTR